MALLLISENKRSEYALVNNIFELGMRTSCGNVSIISSAWHVIT